MTVKELKASLNGFDENLPVTIADYSDDSNEELTCRPLDGIETLKTSGGETVVIYLNS